MVSAQVEIWGDGTRLGAEVAVSMCSLEEVFIKIAHEAGDPEELKKQPPPQQKAAVAAAFGGSALQRPRGTAVAPARPLSPQP